MRKREKIKLVNDIIIKWKEKLYLQEWDLKVKIKLEACENFPGRIADISPNEIYFKATINIYPNFWKESGKEQELDLVHELCHCHTEESDQICRDLLAGCLRTAAHIHDANERLTQRMANIAMGV